MTLRELRKRQEELKAQGRALMKAAADEDRDLTEDEAKKAADIQSELNEVAEKIDAEVARAELDRSFAASDDADGTSDETQAMTPQELQATGGFANLAEFAVAVQRAYDPSEPVDARLLRFGAAPTNYHQESGGSAGEGFSLPPQFRSEIWDLVFDEDDLLGMVDGEPTSGNSVIQITDETTPWGSSGVQANWRAEGTQMSPSKLAEKEQQMRLHELYAFVLATDELLEDVPRLNSRITSKAAQAIRWKANEAIINGTGAGQPLGWMNSAALVTVSKESGQSADTVEGANVAKMWSRLLDTDGGSPLWLMNKTVAPELMQMTLGDRPIWTPPERGFTEAPGGFLFGLPIRWTGHAETLGDKGDVQLVNPKGYYAAWKQSGIKFAQSMHLYFDYNMEAFRWTFRLGGQPHLSAPASPAKGTTLSHFVTLAERA